MLATTNDDPRRQIVLVAAISLFIAGLVLTGITAQKAYTLFLGSLRVDVPVGTTLFVLTFLSTDLITEVYGKKVATYLVYVGFFVRILVACFIYFAVSVEPADWFSEQNEAYSSTLSGSGRILLAGILTFPVSQMSDVYIFHYLRNLHQEKNLLWLRNNVSTFISQTIDSTMFILIAFYGILPGNLLIAMIFGQILVKWLIAVVDTPFVYLLRNIATNRKLNDLSG